MHPPAAHELPDVAALVARAFAEEPFWRWTTGGRAERRACFADLAVALAASEGWLLVAPALTCAALVIEPGVLPHPPRRAVPQLPGLLRSTGPRRLPVALRELHRIERLHPADPHLTLLVLGVDPEHHGLGLGSAALRCEPSPPGPTRASCRSTSRPRPLAGVRCTSAMASARVTSCGSRGRARPCGRCCGPSAAPSLKAMRNIPTWPVAAGSLAVGFAVAQATGVRPLGGLVLLAGAGWCALRWRERAGTPTAVALVALYLAAFVASHLIANALGTWGSVALVSALVGLAAWALADRPAAPARATMSA